MVKVGDKWMTPDERDGLRSKSTDVAIQLHDMLKQGRLKESTPILTTIVVDPSNMSLLYLHGVLNYQEENFSRPANHLRKRGNHRARPRTDVE